MTSREDEVMLLGDAAAMVRAQAEKATPGVWKMWGMSVEADLVGNSDHNQAISVATTHYIDPSGKPRTVDGTYICTMHPPVGKVLADLLDHVGQNGIVDQETWDLAQTLAQTLARRTP